MKNTLGDLNNHLFEQIERLNNEDLNEAELRKEMCRAKAMKEIADKIIENAELILKSQVYKTETLGMIESVPLILGDGTK